MKFIDECTLKVQAGKGGDGLISFRREYRVDRGGPDGGDGGHGGSIFLIGDSGMNTLMPLKYRKHINGQDGENGKRKNMYGAKGENIYVKVPLGTLVYNDKNLVHDITTEHEYLIAKGGKGGRGNVKFKTARNTAPKISEKGDPGEKYQLHLVLKVLADVGFVGKPSAGKSTLLAKISNAKPKIAPYPFTTLVPQLGIVNVNKTASFVAADLPGLIQGAAQGKGLGHEFLKHIDRCRVIAHIIDFGDEQKDPLVDYEQIQAELKSYSLGLEKRMQIIVANKKDLPAFTNNYQKFQKQYPQLEVIAISALTEQNLKLLKQKLFKAYQAAKPIEKVIKTKEVTITLAPKVIIRNPFKGLFEVEGTGVEKIYNKIPLNSWENTQRFNQALRKLDLWNMLRAKKIKNGDIVRIYGYEFQWEDEQFV